MIVGSKEYPVRLSFVHLAEPTLAMDKQRKQYSIQIVIDKKDTKTVAAVEAAIKEAIDLGIGKKMFNAAIAKSPEFRRCMRDGDAKAAEVDDGSQDYLKGSLFFNAACSEDRPPVVVDRFGRSYETADGSRKMIAEEVYSGCYAVVSGNFYPFQHGKGGIAFGLNHVMKRKDGERLDGRESADKAFKDLVDADEETEGDGGEADLR